MATSKKQMSRARASGLIGLIWREGGDHADLTQALEAHGISQRRFRRLRREAGKAERLRPNLEVPVGLFLEL